MSVGIIKRVQIARDLHPLFFSGEREMYHPLLSRCITDVYLIQSIGDVAKV